MGQTNSHRRFITLFREAVGLTPKRYCRVLRLQHVLSRLRSAQEPDLAALAAQGGYSDQAHFTHEFREIAGLTPGSFQKLALRHPHHVPLER